ncbi:hypothetical protein SEA_RIKSENGUPTA_3 [Microbacterium phage RikSengupta]|nr:hypothetical protein SEA_RIKSENGUPTA_3 [Microbacterium phage RikSengupta]
MLELEQRAHLEYWSTPVGMKQELVALGIVEPSGREDTEGTVLWFEMPNTAGPSADGRGEFFVDGTAIWDTLKAAADALGYLRIGADTRRCIDAMLIERVVVLWHTHTATTDPSQEDIDEFPRWLADYGMVYHVPTDTTTVYSKDGIISSITPPLSALVSGEDVPHGG